MASEAPALPPDVTSSSYQSTIASQSRSHW
jgi:hypothetical protein